PPIYTPSLHDALPISENLQPQDFPTGIYPVNLTPNSLSAYEEQSGYKLLFDGQSNAGWVGAYKDAFPAQGWEIKDGTITVLPAEDRKSTRLNSSHVKI